MENKNTVWENSAAADRVTVMSKTGYRPKPKSGSGGNIMSILISLMLIFRGLSGRYVLRGTSSSGALVLAGLAFLAWDIITVIRQKKEQEKAEAEYSARYSRVNRAEKAVAGDERALPSDINVRITYDKSLAALDIAPRLNGRSMSQDSKNREFTGATQNVKNIISFLSLDLMAVFEIPPDSGEIVIELFKDKSGFGIAMPGRATLLPQPQL